MFMLVLKKYLDMQLILLSLSQKDSHKSVRIQKELKYLGELMFLKENTLS
jgi:hypothetical protein